MKKRNSLAGEIAYALGNIGMTAAAIVIGGGAILSEAANKLVLDQDTAIEQLGIDPGYVPAELRNKNFQVSFRDKLGTGGYRLFFNTTAEEAKNFKSQSDYADVRSMNGKKLCHVFSATNPTNTDQLFAQRMGLGAQALGAVISPQELTAFALIHEFRHCAQGPGGNEMAQEADADSYAIRAIEAKNPASNIRKVVTSWRAITNNHENALALDQMLNNDLNHRASQIQTAEKSFHSLQETALRWRGKPEPASAEEHIKIAKSIADSPENDKLVRQRAQLEINAYQWLITTANAASPAPPSKTPAPVRPG